MVDAGEDASGMGEGQGTKDVSDQIEESGQLEGTKVGATFLTLHFRMMLRVGMLVMSL